MTLPRFTSGKVGNLDFSHLNEAFGVIDGLDRAGPVTGGEIGGERLDGGRIGPPVHRHPGAVGGQDLRRGAPDPPGGPGDEGDAAGEEGLKDWRGHGSGAAGERVRMIGANGTERQVVRERLRGRAA